MSCPTEIIYHDLPDAFAGCTCDWLTITITDVPEGDTEFASALVSVILHMKDAVSGDEITLSSANEGQITLNETAANAWSFTVESLTLNLTPGVYSYAIVTTDAEGIIYKFAEGTRKVHPSPLS